MQEEHSEHVTVTRGSINFIDAQLKTTILQLSDSDRKLNYSVCVNNDFLASRGKIWIV